MEIKQTTEEEVLQRAAQGDDTPTVTENTDTPSDPVEESEPEIDEDMINYAIQKYTGGRFETYRDIESQLEELRQKLELVSVEIEDDEEILEMREFKKMGKTLDEFYEVKSINPDKLSGQKLLWERYKIENRELYKENPDAARILFENEYKRDFDVDEDADDSEKTLKEAYLRSKEISAKKFLSDFKGQSLPKVEKRSKVDDVYNKNKDLIETHFKTVEGHISKIEKIKYPIGEEGDFLIDVNDKTDTGRALREEITDFMKQPNVYLTKAVVQDGKVDYDRLTLMGVIVADPEAFVERVLQHGIALGQKKLISSTKNQSQGIDKPLTQTSKSDDIGNALSKLFRS